MDRNRQTEDQGTIPTERPTDKLAAALEQVRGGVVTLPEMTAAVRGVENPGSRGLWAAWLALFGVAEYTALSTGRIAPLTDFLRFVAGSRQTGTHARARRWAFTAFLLWLWAHVMKKESSK